MSVVELLSSLAKKDIRLWLDGENLRFSAPEGAFTPDIKNQIVANKPAIMEFLKQAQKATAETIPCVSRDKPLRASYGQQRLWLLDQLNPGDVTYNMPTALRIKGFIDPTLLDQAFQAIVARHEVLRTYFEERDGEPYQVIRDNHDWALTRIDISESAPEEKERQIQHWVNEDALTSFDLSQGPLFRGKLITVNTPESGAPECVLVACMHHIISDGWSMEVLVKEMMAFYMAKAANSPSILPELPIQYADYAEWQRDWVDSDEQKEHLQYWVKTLEGAPPVLTLPTDKPRSELVSNRGSVVKFDLPPTLFTQVEAYCDQHKLTPYMVTLGAWQLLLSRFANANDVVVGAPVAGRDRGETQDLIGFFVNMLLLRVRVNGSDTVAQFLDGVRTSVLDGFSHQDLPIDMLMEAMSIERQPGYSPLAQAAFQLINVQGEGEAASLGMGPLEVTDIPSASGSARMEMVLGVGRLENSYSASLEYNTDLFSESTITTLVAQYEHVLQALTGDRQQTLDEIQLFTEEALITALGGDATLHEVLPLNSYQRDFYLAHKVNPQNIENVYGISVELETALDESVLAQALAQVTRQQTILTSRMVESHLPGTDEAYFLVHPQDEMPLHIVDVPDELSEYADKLMHAPMDLLRDPLAACYLLKQPSGQQRLVLRYHHALMDGASTFLHMDGILAAYEAQRRGGQVTEQATEQAIVLSDASIAVNQAYQQWDAANVDNASVVEFWQDALSTVEPLQFSMPETYRKREGINAFNDDTVSLTFPSALLEKVKAYCAAQGISLPLFFKGVYGILVQHYCRAENDFHIAEFNSNRRVASETELGCFYQQVPMVFPIALFAKDSAIDDVFAYEKAFRGKTQPYRALSLSQQAALLPQAPAIFMYNYYNFVLSREVAGQHVRPVMSAPKVERGVQLIIGDAGDSIELVLRYDLESFVDLSMLERIVTVAEQVVDADIQRMSQLSYTLARETQQAAIVGESRPLLSGDGAYSTIIEWFQAQVSRSPDATALIYGDTVISYDALNQKANQLARYLVTQGVTPGCRVGVCLDRSAELIVAIWGVLKAGGAYVPMDANYPKERLGFLATDCQAPLVISHSALVDRLPRFDEPCLLVDKAWGTESPENLSALSTDNLNVPVQDSDPIYTIYTSGSTGQPKGAAVTHRGELNLQQWYTEEMGFAVDTTTLLVSAVGFDLTQKNLFAVLLQGGTLVIPQMDLFDEELLLTLIDQHKVSVVNCAPSAFYPLVETAAYTGYDALSSLRHVVLGGEPIQLSLLYPWLASENGHAELINSYGPTECTDVVAFHRLTDIRASNQIVPIGLPIQNTELYLLTDNNQPVAPGCVGELCIAGTGVGLGYLNRDELTDTVFIDNPFGEGKLYRTGDLARYQKDGNLVYVGRKDFQIKLRGLRIELGEIEWSLQQLPDVKDGLVLLKNDELVAYVVSDQQSIVDWRSQLQQHLPEYMVPSALVVLPQWPLTPNGKVDRKALPEPTDAESTKAEYIAPRSELESQLVSIWQDVLEVPQVGVLDNLFDLGGNSLLATRIISRVKKAFSIDVQVRDLFVSPTVSDLAMLVRHAQKGGVSKAPEMLAVDKQGPLPISFAQQRLWFLDQLDPGTPVYNMPGAIRLEGALDSALLNRVFGEIVRRHDSLRTRFVQVDEQPMQIIDDSSTWHIEMSDISHLPVEDRDLEALRQAQKEVSFNFDLAEGPLIRTRLLKLAEDIHVLIVNMHHIISDGWSNGILMQDLVSIYDAFSHGRPSPLPDLPIQYADFSVWQRNWLTGDVLQEQLDYWTSQLLDVPVLELPFDNPRGSKQTYNGAFEKIQLSASLSRRLQQLARQKGATLYQVMLAGFNVLLHKYSGQADFAVGTPIANRNRAELEGIIGFFVNTLALRAHVAPEESFAQQLERVREHSLDAYAYQDVPFERLVDELQVPRDMSHSPIFQVMFNLVNGPVQQQVQLPGLHISAVGEEHENVKFDLMLDLADIDGVIQGSLGFNTDLFLPDTATGMVTHLVSLLDAVVAEPDLAIEQLDWLSKEDKQQQLVEWNQTQVDYPTQKTVHEWFCEQAQKTPSNIAIQMGNQQMRYDALDRYSNQVARFLVDSGVAEGESVGLCLDRCMELMPAILGILKAGAVYVPLDASYPHGRIEYIINNAGISQILTRADIATDLPQGPWEYIDIAGQAAIAQADAAALPLRGTAEQLLYVIYTSGSTGRPKGTGAYHRSEVNLLSWYGREFSMTEKDNVLLMSALGFDLTQKNLFAPLVHGATLVIPESQEYDPQRLLRTINDAQVTWLNCAPSAFYPLQDDASDWSHLTTLSRVFLGGEAINLPRLQAWCENASCDVINSYGPTECTDIASWYRVDMSVDMGRGTVPIGRPNDNVKLYVVDAANQLLPVGAIGELCIGGDSVGPGYVFNPELSAEAFVTNPNLKSAEIMYKTGDLVRYRHDGLIDYLGRKDHQVKLRGFRIETSEIQSVINEHTKVSESLVAVVDHPVMGQQLIAWVVVPESIASSVDETQRITDTLQSDLGHMLPGYMVPSAFVLMSAFPLTPNGKVDRKQLPEAVLSADMDDIIPPEGATEVDVAAIFSAVLGQDTIGSTANFFTLGGHSLLATQVVSRIKKQFSVDVPLRDMFESPTVRDISALIDRALAEGGASTVPDVIAIDRDGHLPLSFVQQQLWLLDQLSPGTSAYNMPVALRLKGELDVKVLNAAISTIVERHETLRCNFVVVDETPHVVIHDPMPWKVDVVDLSDLSGDAQEQQIAQRSQEEFAKGFDLAAGPLYRTTLLQLASAEGADQEWVFLSTMHHMISDGWSMDVMVQELGMLYAALKDQARAPLPNLPVQYVDYAAWQREWMQGEELDRQIQYWREQLDNEFAVLDLPTDYPRPAVQTANGAAVKLDVAEATVANLERVAKAQGATLFMSLLAAFNVVLHRYSGQERINVGVPVAGRNRTETEPLIGMFINTVVVASDLTGEPTYRELLSRVKEQSLGAFSHQALPFEKIVTELKPKRDLSRTPFFQVFFNLLNLPESSQQVSGLTIESLVANESDAHAKYDLNLYAKQTAEGLQFYMVYNTDLFSRSTIERLLSHLNHYLDVVSTAPDTHIYEVALETSAEATPDIKQVIEDVEYPHPLVTIEQQLPGDKGNSIALRDANGDMSYDLLSQKVAALASVLQCAGSSQDEGLKGKTVAIYAQRSSALVVSLLGVMRSGAAFFILDPAYPETRLRQYVSIAQPVACINLLDSMTPQLQQDIEGYVGDAMFTVSSRGDVQYLADSQDGASIGELEALDVQRLAYIAFTSGTTGEPKAIAGNANPIGHFIDWYQQTYSLRAEDTFSLLSGLAHDPLLRDIFVPLSLGATLTIPTAETMNNPSALLQWMQDERVSVSHLTPAMGQLMTGAHEWDSEEGVPDGKQLPDLRLAVFGGDRLYVGGVKAMQAYAPAVTCVNFYGATETPQAMAHQKIQLDGSEKDTQWLPIGTAIDGVQLLVVTTRGGVAAPNEVGEIVIRSPYLSQGYVNDSGEESPFTNNPLTFAPDDSVYRTGDRGRYLANGSVEFLGRIDQQIKIRGYRVELAEIQQALNELDGVKQSVVVDCIDRRGDLSLVAYIVSQETELGQGDGVDTDSVRMHLRSRLPEYMLPAAFIDISQVPLTPNGKVDKLRLPDPSTAFVEEEYVAPRNEIEQAIADIWQTILKIEQVSVLSNFFDVGGHSLLATQIVSRVEALYEVKFPLKVLFQSATIEGMASYVDTTLWARKGLEADDAEEDDDDDMEEFEL